MITRLIVSVPGSVDGVWRFEIGDKFYDYTITKIVSGNAKVSLHDGERLLRVFNNSHVICTDYI